MSVVTGRLFLEGNEPLLPCRVEAWASPPSLPSGVVVAAPGGTINIPVAQQRLVARGRTEENGQFRLEVPSLAANEVVFLRCYLEDRLEGALAPAAVIRVLPRHGASEPWSFGLGPFSPSSASNLSLRVPASRIAIASPSSDAGEHPRSHTSGTRTASLSDAARIYQRIVLTRVWLDRELTRAHEVLARFPEFTPLPAVRPLLPAVTSAIYPQAEDSDAHFSRRSRALWFGIDACPDDDIVHEYGHLVRHTSDQGWVPGGPHSYGVAAVAAEALLGHTNPQTGAHEGGYYTEEYLEDIRQEQQRLMAPLLGGRPYTLVEADRTLAIGRATFPCLVRQMAVDFNEAYASLLAVAVLGVRPRGRGPSSHRRMDTPDYETPNMTAPAGSSLVSRAFAAMGDARSTAYLWDLADGRSRGEAWDRVEWGFGVVHLLHTKWVDSLAGRTWSPPEIMRPLPSELRGKYPRTLPGFHYYLWRFPNLQMNDINAVAVNNGLQPVFDVYDMAGLGAGSAAAEAQQATRLRAARS